jgi:hypothetical protein
MTKLAGYKTDQRIIICMTQVKVGNNLIMWRAASVDGRCSIPRMRWICQNSA